MFKLRFLMFAAICAAVLSSCKSTPTPEPVRADGLVNSFVIKGATITPQALAEGNFVTPDNIALTDIPDSELDIVLHHNGSISTTKKSTIALLFPSVNEFTVDGNTMSANKFYAEVPASMLTCVEPDGDRLVATTRADVNDDNPLRTEEMKNEEEWYLANVTPIDPTEQIVIDDFTTYPDNTDFAIDEIITARDSLINFPKDRIGAITYSHYGNVPVAHIHSTKETWYTERYRGHIWYGTPASTFPILRVSELLKEKPDTLSIAEITLAGPNLYLIPLTR